MCPEKRNCDAGFDISYRKYQFEWYVLNNYQSKMLLYLNQETVMSVRQNEFQLNKYYGKIKKRKGSGDT